MPVPSRTTTASKLIAASTPREPEALVGRGLRALAEEYPALAAWLPDEERRRLGLPVDPAPPKRWRFRRMDNGAHLADAVEMPGGRTVLLMPNGGYVGFGTFNEVVSHLGTTVARPPVDFRWSCLDEAPAPPAAPAPFETQGEDWAHRVASSIVDDTREVPMGASICSFLTERIAKALRDVREWVPDRIVGELADARTGETTTVFRLRQPGGRVVKVVAIFPATDAEPSPPLPSDTVLCCARCGATCASAVACETCGGAGAVFELPRWALDMMRTREAALLEQARQVSKPTVSAEGGW